MSVPRPAGRRYAVPGLATPHPLGERLPGPYADDDFTGRFVAAFDEVLAPVFCVLDCLDAYWNPALAPEDFLDWLAHWVAADLGDQPPAARRAAVASATDRHRLRGTARGLAEQVRAVLGGDPQVSESGGAAWSAEPGGPLPGSPQPWLRLRVRLSSTDRATVTRLLAPLVEANRPAHVPWTVELMEGGSGADL
ncbi:phage tail protein [Kitasatospora nipponensis]|uniref:Phage tail protein n=1 Tax=Kitasatospora nipponensis TaxID=258049 RepID=A0ABN1VM62_9ACTN